MEPIFYTPEQVAELLCTTEGTLRFWRSEKTGPPYVKVGFKVLYRISDIMDYIEAGTRRTTGQTQVG